MEIWIYKRIRLFKKNVDIQKGASILGKCRYTEGDVYFRKMWIYREWVHFIQKKKKKTTTVKFRETSEAGNEHESRA